MATGETTSRRRDVATTLRLNGHVTPRSIAYTATQVRFCQHLLLSFPNILYLSLFSR